MSHTNECDIHLMVIRDKSGSWKKRKKFWSWEKREQWLPPLLGRRHTRSPDHSPGHFKATYNLFVSRRATQCDHPLKMGHALCGMTIPLQENAHPPHSLAPDPIFNNWIIKGGRIRFCKSNLFIFIRFLIIHFRKTAITLTVLLLDQTSWNMWHEDDDPLIS